MVATLNEVGRAMPQLSECQRIALLMVAYEGLTYEEAATWLGIPIGTLKTKPDHRHVPTAG